MKTNTARMKNLQRKKNAGNQKMQKRYERIARLKN